MNIWKEQSNGTGRKDKYRGNRERDEIAEAIKDKPGVILFLLLSTNLMKTQKETVC